MASQRLSSGALAAIEAAVAAEQEADEYVRAVPAASAAPEPAAAAEPAAQEEPEPAPQPRERRPGLWQRAQARLSEDGGSPRPRRGRGRAPAAERPAPPERLCLSCGRPIPPERLDALPEALQCLDCKRAGREIPEQVAAAEPPAVRVLPPEPAAAEPEPPVEPEPEPVAESEPEPEPEPEPEIELPIPVPPEPQRWNVWELERLARVRSGQDVARDEEWSILREFADPDGNLSTDFDALVRESFPELLGSPASR
jgi:hypothetical protein